ncbi:MAG: hypothetical protein ACJAS1_001637 [Oleiphilaceae bacterium]|jgi:hypothetical protein
MITNKSTSKEKRERFLELYTSSDSITINDEFIRYFDNDALVTDGDPNQEVIAINGEDHILLSITNELLDKAKFVASDSSWHLGSYEIKFHTVTTIAG